MDVQPSHIKSSLKTVNLDKLKLSLAQSFARSTLASCFRSYTLDFYCGGVQFKRWLGNPNTVTGVLIVMLSHFG